LTGRNLAEAISNSETGDLIHAIDQGAKMVYIDPRFTKTAAKANEWLPIRPGTDLALHLAFINVIISEERYNKEFVSKYTVGFDELAASIGQYTPEWAAEITGISVETIRRIAQEFSDAAPNALAHNGWRTSNFINSFQTERAITILNTLVGNWGVTLLPAGGEESGCFGKPPQPGYPAIRRELFDLSHQCRATRRRIIRAANRMRRVSFNRRAYFFHSHPLHPMQYLSQPRKLRFTHDDLHRTH